VSKKSAKDLQNKSDIQNDVANKLPQNIQVVGERVLEDKNIYISQTVYKAIHQFSKKKTSEERGGVLVGKVVEEMGKINIIISGFIEAKHGYGTGTTFTFTHDFWDYCHDEISKKHSKSKIIGWIHTHPNFGVFLSDNDKFIHENYFKEVSQIAYVVDPIKGEEGFYFWINNKIEKCVGFYIFEEVGKKIDVFSIDSQTGKADASLLKNASIFSVKNIFIAGLTIITVFLVFCIISLNGEVKSLKSELATFENNTIQVINSLGIQLSNIYDNSLKEVPAQSSSNPSTTPSLAQTPLPSPQPNK